MPKRLRRRAGAEWLKGKVADEPKSEATVEAMTKRIEMLEAVLQGILWDANKNEAEAEEMGWSGVEVLRSSIKRARAVLEDDDG